MNKKIRSKLKMEKPEYYDSTEGKAAVVHRSDLENDMRNCEKRGIKLGALPGLLGSTFSFLLTIITAQGFEDKFGVSGSTWEAIFLVALTLSFVALLVTIILVLRDWKSNGSLNVSKVVEEKYFDEDKKI